MRALLYAAVGKMLLEEIPEPHVGPGELLLRVSAVGICGSELEAFRHPNAFRRPPLVMGHEIAGVTESGESVVVNPLLTCARCELCLSGKRQLCRQRQLIGVHRPGGFAEHVAVPVAACRATDDRVSAEAAVFAEPLANALHSLRVLHRHAERPSRLGVIGAGAIGLAVALAAIDQGIESVTVVDLARSRLAAAQELPVQTATELKGEFDAIIDAVGLATTRATSLAHLAPGGPTVWIGLASPEAGIDSRELIRNERLIVGSYAYEEAEFDAAVPLAASVPASWIETVTLRHAARRFIDLTNAPGTRPKTVIVPSNEAM